MTSSKFSTPNQPLPLNGKTVLVTRSAGQSSQFTALLEAQGATVLEMPVLEIGPPSSWQGLDRAIDQLDQFDWLILTSTNGIDYFFERLAAKGLDGQALNRLKVAVVGQKTATSLQSRGVTPDFIPPNFVADSLVEHFPDRPTGLKILFPRVETGGREVLVKELTDQGAIVTEVPAYESGCAKTVPAEVLAALQQGGIDVVTFASSKTVQYFCQLLASVAPTDQASLETAFPFLQTVCLASIGPQTSVTCQQRLGRVDVEAQEFTLAGLTAAIVQWALTNKGISRNDEAL